MSNDDGDWAPSCDSAQLRARAQLLARVRAYFAEQGLLEVETPILARHTVTDPHLAPFATRVAPHGSSAAHELFLQTSPEFAMKRLLAAGSGSIFQICKAFRNGEIGRWHNPEFTLLEWYRVGFGLDQLIGDVTALLTRLAAGHRTFEPALRLSYAEAFTHYIGADPIAADLGEFDRRARSLGFAEASDICGSDRANWLDFLFSHAVQPHLGQGRLIFIVDYPGCLPSLARPHPADPDLVERVEVFLDGIELGNGFHELADSTEQERRFDRDNAQLARLGRPPRNKDRYLLEALRSGLPDCSGIALGLDRLLTLLTGASAVADVLAFPVSNA